MNTLLAEIETDLGAERTKLIVEGLALVIAQNGLTRSPELCRKIFRYMSEVVTGWNPQ